MKTSLLLILVFTLIAAPEAGWTQSKYQYLIDTTNKLMDVLGRSTFQDPKELGEACARVCHTLRELLDDKRFRDDLYRIAKREDKYSEERQQLTWNLSLFVQSFLRAEEEALKKAGLSEDAVKQIVWSASLFKNAVDDELDPTRTILAIKQLHDDVCQGEKIIRETKEQSERKRMFRNWAFRLGGIALIVVDVTTLVPSGALTMGSVTIGTAVVEWALKA